jgi:hypothetical protein
MFRSFSLFPAVLVIPLLVSASAVAQHQPDGAAAARYRAQLSVWERLHGSYERVANAYWNQIADKRRIRIIRRRAHEQIGATDYVLRQPPVYSGPPRPVDPFALPRPPVEHEPVPVVADFLKAAADAFDFVPDLPHSDRAFKQAYAMAALSAGLTREQVIGVYAFETGGNGSYDTQAGITPKRSRAISPALGYNQLLSTNTVSLLAEFGNRYLAALRQKAVMLRGEQRHAFDRKIEALRRMIEFCRSIPPHWSDYDRVAKTTQRGWGVHAAVLDVDIGPLLQVQKLIDSVNFARAKGYTSPLTAPELELMNLTGDGNGIDMVMMPPSLRARVPTANFFQPRGYERNPVARRTGVVANLLAEIAQTMQRGEQSQGARDLAEAF